MLLRLSILVLIICILYVTGCAVLRLPPLSKQERAWIDVYNEGDTLIFKSSAGTFDTSIITKKRVYYSELNLIEYRGGEQIGEVWYTNKRLKYNPHGAELIGLIRHRKETNMRIDYLYSGAFVLNIRNNPLEKIRQGDVYEFDTFHPKAEHWQPKKIFWHMREGIVRYITHDNEEWKRIN
ncbi:MAG TPA: hypothetical protein VD993_18625 [Chitinophagaceae bacterium]|nr:hypothetical protein [Chitinophagaceae bacterium]